MWLALSVYVLEAIAHNWQGLDTSVHKAYKLSVALFSRNLHYLRPSAHRHRHEFKPNSQPTEYVGFLIGQ